MNRDRPSVTLFRTTFRIDLFPFVVTLKTASVHGFAKQGGPVSIIVQCCLVGDASFDVSPDFHLVHTDWSQLRVKGFEDNTDQQSWQVEGPKVIKLFPYVGSKRRSLVSRLEILPTAN